MLPAACIIPESSARPDWVAPLVALFSPLVYLSPVPETIPPENDLRQMAENGQLLALSPSMPPAAAEKLGYLARSLEGSESVQHGEQLKQLILESLGTESDLEASSNLRRQLRSGTQEEGNSTPVADLLWQERLLLLLADKSEREQEELARAFSRISKQHRELLSSLDDSQKEMLEDLLPPEPEPHQEKWQPKRLQAWARLFRQTTIPRQIIWHITRQEGLAAQILEQHQTCVQEQAYHLPELLLPAYLSNAQHKSAASPIQACPKLLAAFSEFHSFAPDGAATDIIKKAADCIAAEIPAWNAEIRAIVPAETGLYRLRLSILPGASLLHLLQNSLAHTPASAEDARTGTDQDLCLFGLLLGNAQADRIRI